MVASLLRVNGYINIYTNISKWNTSGKYTGMANKVWMLVTESYTIS